jgi:hypothetical protein
LYKINERAKSYDNNNKNKTKRTTIRNKKMVGNLMETLTIGELIHYLEQFDHSLEVYLSCDSEGNSYSTIDGRSFSFYKRDGKVVIYPMEEGLDLADICPVAVGDFVDQYKEYKIDMHDSYSSDVLSNY